MASSITSVTWREYQHCQLLVCFNSQSVNFQHEVDNVQNFNIYVMYKLIHYGNIKVLNIDNPNFRNYLTDN